MKQEQFNAAVTAGLELLSGKTDANIPYSPGIFFLHNILERIASGELTLTGTPEELKPLPSKVDGKIVHDPFNVGGEVLGEDFDIKERDDGTWIKTPPIPKTAPGEKE